MIRPHQMLMIIWLWAGFTATAQSWTNTYNGPWNNVDQATAIVVDRSSGNVYVTGHSAHTDDYPKNEDYATIAYTSEGALLWTRRYNGPGNSDDWAYAIAVGPSGNVYVTGFSESQLASPASRDYATIAYTSGGMPLWTNRYDGPGNRSDGATAIAVDGNDTVYVTGSSLSADNPDYATVAYTSTGVALWTNRYDGPGNRSDGATAIAVGPSGNVYVTGSYDPDSYLNDYATVAYTSGGMPLWTNFYNGPANSYDDAYAIAVGPGGNVYVTGSSYDPASSLSDYATVAYTSGGMPLWTNFYNGPGNENDSATAIAVDDRGDVYVTGYAARVFWPINWDYVTIKYAVGEPAPVPLGIQTVAGQVVLTWSSPAFQLQSASAVTGPFTNMPAATSPYTNPITGAQHFFRLYSP